jgi:hypothetical protein
MLAYLILPVASEKDIFSTRVGCRPVRRLGVVSCVEPLRISYRMGNAGAVLQSFRTQRFGSTASPHPAGAVPAGFISLAR